MSNIKMSLEEIEMRMPEMCAENPTAKYNIYATINDLCEDEKIEIDNIINSLILQRSIIHKQYLEKCNITADYDVNGNLNE